MTSHRPLHTLRSHGLWITALLRRRTGRLGAMVVGVALAVGLLASLGTFLSASKATMTRRAIETIAVDWQIELQRGADVAAVTSQIAGDKNIAVSTPVSFATSTGFEHHTGGTTHTTGSGQVVGIDDKYRTLFPAQFRTLLGANNGVLLFQQTAANLAAQPGDTITVGRAGLTPVTVTVAGIVDIPQADSLFQTVGAPPGAQPSAPPDNVLIVPTSTWHQLFDPLAQARPDLTRTQIHARLDHHLPPDPSAAYSAVTGRVHNLELRLTGAVLVGDNLGATLAAARSDALYAQVLFLFLGAPGAVLAGLLTAAVAGSGRQQRRRQQALLRTRGVTTRQLVGLATSEAAVVGLVGSALGLALAALVGKVAFGTTSFGATTATTLAWFTAAIAVGLLIAVTTYALPARRDARDLTVADARRTMQRRRNPRWMRWGLDVVLLAIAGTVYWLTSRNGYHLVLAVEGVPSISVSYWAFAGPVLLWSGAGLLAYRLTTLAAEQGRPLLARAFRPLSGGLSDTVAASLQRQRRVVAHGAALVTLTVGFAASTAVFNATYRQQAEVDAVLSNGADVTVTTSPGTHVAPTSPQAGVIASTPGVHHVEPLQHRFAYVGADLQDLYGVNPATIVDAGKLQDAYFQGGTARQLMARLTTQPDAILVSAETVRDFQLQPGDTIKLRLQRADTNQFTDVPFHYVGVAKEFPTAPHDSFLLANAAYIAAATGNDSISAFLVDTGGRHISSIADTLRQRLGASASVTDLATTRKVVGSSLTAVDLGGLTRVELGFALALAAAATGLTLWLGLAERKRTFAIATALGANQRQLGAFVWTEAVVTSGAGLLAGVATAWTLSNMLVNVLQGVFDPAPATLAVPWTYLICMAAIAAGATGAAAFVAVRAARTPHPELLRAL